MLAQAQADAAYANLAPDAARTLEAIAARLVPSDENGPGAVEAGAVRYIDRALGGALAAHARAYTDGLEALDRHARAAAGRAFSELEPGRQDAILAALERNEVGGFEPDSASFFERVLGHTLEGTFCDPRYGGNRDFIGWTLIGYPGIRLAVAPDEQRMDAELAPTRLSAYDLPMFDGGPGGAEDEP